MAAVSAGDHLLVYTTGEGNDSFAEALRKTGLECRIYGMRRGLTEEVVEGNLRFQPFGYASPPPVLSLFAAPSPTLVIPAKAGIHGSGTRMAARRRRSTVSMDPGFRRDDERGEGKETERGGGLV